jgi:hypothetical protein
MWSTGCPLAKCFISNPVLIGRKAPRLQCRFDYFVETGDPFAGSADLTLAGAGLNSY